VKRKTIASLISTVAFVVFIGFLVSAFLPLATGGIELEDMGESSVQSSGKTFRVEWSPEIRTSLPYDMTVNARVCAGEDAAVTLASMSEKFSKGTTRLNVRGEISAVTLMLLVTSKDSENGIFMPLELRFQGSYPYSLFKVGLEASTLVKVSDTGTISTQWRTDRVSVDLFGIGGNMSGLDSFSGTIGPDITVTVTGAHNKATMEIRSSSGNLAESLENALDSNGNLTMQLSGETIVLKSSEASELIKLVKKGAGA